MHKWPFVYVVSLILPLSYFSIHKFHINPQTLENSGGFRGGGGGGGGGEGGAGPPP